MGLDMYVYEGTPSDDPKPIMYWRKHYGLHTWMRSLFLKKGGDKKEMFNRGDTVELTLDDIESLHATIKKRKEDFFTLFDDFHADTYSQYERDYRSADFKFIYKAKRKLNQGKRLFYES